jgi:hypothetical protein
MFYYNTHWAKCQAIYFLLNLLTLYELYVILIHIGLLGGTDMDLTLARTLEAMKNIEEAAL